MTTKQSILWCKVADGLKAAASGPESVARWECWTCCWEQALSERRSGCEFMVGGWSRHGQNCGHKPLRFIANPPPDNLRANPEWHRAAGHDVREVKP